MMSKRCCLGSSHMITVAVTYSTSKLRYFVIVISKVKIHFIYEYPMTKSGYMKELLWSIENVKMKKYLSSNEL
jgi:hypothetical protein